MSKLNEVRAKLEEKNIGEKLKNFFKGGKVKAHQGDTLIPSFREAAKKFIEDLKIAYSPATKEEHGKLMEVLANIDADYSRYL